MFPVGVVPWAGGVAQTGREEMMAADPKSKAAVIRRSLLFAGIGDATSSVCFIRMSVRFGIIAFPNYKRVLETLLHEIVQRLTFTASAAAYRLRPIHSQCRRRPLSRLRCRCPERPK